MKGYRIWDGSCMTEIPNDVLAKLLEARTNAGKGVSRNDKIKALIEKLQMWENEIETLSSNGGTTLFGEWAITYKALNEFEKKAIAEKQANVFFDGIMEINGGKKLIYNTIIEEGKRKTVIENYN